MTGDAVLADGQAAALMVLGRKGQELPAAANTFVKKLYNIVTFEDDAVIAWNEAGDSFTIVDPKALETDVLPKYFRHSRYSSLVRQLNFYSFKKITKERCMWVYKHEYFLRDKPELLELVKRKTPTTSPTVSPLLETDGERKLSTCLPPSALLRSVSAPPENMRAAPHHHLSFHSQSHAPMHRPRSGFEGIPPLDGYSRAAWGQPPQRRPHGHGPAQQPFSSWHPSMYGAMAQHRAYDAYGDDHDTMHAMYSGYYFPQHGMYQAPGDQRASGAMSMWTAAAAAAASAATSPRDLSPATTVDSDTVSCADSDGMATLKSTHISEPSEQSSHRCRPPPIAIGKRPEQQRSPTDENCLDDNETPSSKMQKRSPTAVHALHVKRPRTGGEEAKDVELAAIAMLEMARAVSGPC